MPRVHLKDPLRHARANAYVIGAYDVVDCNFIAAVIASAERARAAVIVSFAESHFAHYDFPALVAAARGSSKTRQRAGRVVPRSRQRAGIRRGRDPSRLPWRLGVMVDASHLSLDENVAVTCAVVAMAHAVYMDASRLPRTILVCWDR